VILVGFDPVIRSILAKFAKAKKREAQATDRIIKSFAERPDHRIEMR